MGRMPLHSSTIGCCPRRNAFGVPQVAGLAKETGRDPERYFWWLYGREGHGVLKVT